mgnify:CR=1 FL=1
MLTCPLCQNKSTPFYKDEFYECSCCKGIFRPKEKLLNNELEKLRYESHTNDSSDLGYQNFVSPITSNVLNAFIISICLLLWCKDTTYFYIHKLF